MWHLSGTEATRAAESQSVAATAAERLCRPLGPSSEGTARRRAHPELRTRRLGVVGVKLVEVNLTKRTWCYIYQ